MQRSANLLNSDIKEILCRFQTLDQSPPANMYQSMAAEISSLKRKLGEAEAKIQDLSEKQIKRERGEDIDDIEDDGPFFGQNSNKRLRGNRS